MSSYVSARRFKDPNNQLNPWNKVIIEKLTVAKVVKEHPLLWKL
jgi:hypothetical protein